jgi:hypothetical protein
MLGINQIERDLVLWRKAKFLRAPAFETIVIEDAITPKSRYEFTHVVWWEYIESEARSVKSPAL